jgi:hypothetical protein
LLTYCSFSRLPPPPLRAWQNPRNPHMRIGWLVNEDNFERALSLRNGPHLPTTQCACAEFEDFAMAMAVAAVKKIY